MIVRGEGGCIRDKAQYLESRRSNEKTHKNFGIGFRRWGSIFIACIINANSSTKRVKMLTGY